MNIIRIYMADYIWFDASFANVCKIANDSINSRGKIAASYNCILYLVKKCLTFMHTGHRFGIEFWCSHFAVWCGVCFVFRCFISLFWVCYPIIRISMILRFSNKSRTESCGVPKKNKLKLEKETESWVQWRMERMK